MTKTGCRAKARHPVPGSAQAANSSSIPCKAASTSTTRDSTWPSARSICVFDPLSAVRIFDVVASPCRAASIRPAMRLRSTSSAALHPLFQPLTEYLFQRIEDARVQRRGVAVDASLEPYLLKFHDEAFRQREAEYRGKHGGADPWTSFPQSQRDQLLLAVERRLFHPSDTLTLHPNVAACLAACENRIVPVWAGTTETSGLAAAAVADEMVKAELPT